MDVRNQLPTSPLLLPLHKRVVEPLLVEVPLVPHVEHVQPGHNMFNMPHCKDKDIMFSWISIDVRVNSENLNEGYFNGEQEIFRYGNVNNNIIDESSELFT